MVRTQIALAVGLVSVSLGVNGQVVYQSEITDAVINSRTIDVSKPVGAIAGAAGVSAIGAATYTIPIVIPPGTNGMQPQLALTYNSNGGDGVLGIGWALAGLSAIQRVGSDNYHDGAAAPVTFTGADHFALDGQRLVNTSSSSYENGTYDTEVAQFKYYSRVGTYGSGPAGFSGTGKDGMTSFYGWVDNGSESALIKRSSDGEALGWLLSKIVDPFGNEIRYNYSTGSLNEAKRLASINYTSNPAQGIAAYNSVEFTYNTRTDKTTLYNAGSEFKNEYLLEKVVVKAEGLIIMTYPLKYAFRQNNSYLCEVGQLTNGGSLNSTIIKYGELTGNITTPSTFYGIAGQNADIFTADFDGNGKADILAAHYAYDGNTGNKYHTDFSVYLNGSSSATFSYTFSGSDISQIGGYGGAQRFLATDYNGDGRDDIVVTRMHWHSPNQQYFFTGGLLFLSTSSTLDNDAEFTVTDIGRPDLGSSNNSYSWFAQQQAAELIPGDFDGDGRFEIMACLSKATSLDPPQISLWELDGFSGAWVAQTADPLALTYFDYAKDFTGLDIDGDGASDLLVRVTNGDANNPISSFRRLGKTSAGNWFADLSSFSLNTWNNIGIYPADFNGDGKNDILIKKDSFWYIRFSNGNSFGPQLAFSLTESDGSKVRIADINGDGRSDILHGYYYSFTNTNKLAIYTSNGLYGSALFSSDEINSTANHSFTSLAIGDLNGDGKSDLLDHHYYQQPVDIYYFWKNTQERRADKIVDGMNAKVDFDWKYMTDPIVHTESTEVYEYPDHDVQFPLPLVWKVSSSNGVGGMNTLTHKYRNGWGWVNGPGFVGFRSHTVSDPAANRLFYEGSTPTGVVATMLPAETADSLLSPLTALTHTVFAPTLNILSSGMRRFTIRMLQSWVTDQLSGSQVITTNSGWDATDNLQQTVVNTVGVMAQQTNVTYGPALPYSYYSPSKPTSVTVTTIRSGAPAIILNTAYSYNVLNGSLAQKIEFNNKPIKTTTDYLYFPTGNLQQSTLSYTNLPVNDRRVSSWTYDSKYRYPSTATTKWNNNGTLVDVTESFTYDMRWGKVTKHISTDQLITDHVFDVFGRETSVSAPYLAGNPRYNVTKQYTWDVTGTKVWYDTTTDPGGPDSKVWHDLLGREVETQVASFTPTYWTTSNQTFDAAGRVLTTTLPRLQSETAQIITNNYDNFGRIVSATNSFSGPTTYDYSYVNGELTTEVTHANRTTSSTVDAAGKTVSAHDDGGTLTYTYDSWGNVLTVKHGTQTMVTSTYDTYGRQTKLQDASGGPMEYTYNAFGLLTSQKNAMQQTTTMVYDNLGRLKSRTEPEGISTWAYYYVGGKFNNNLVTETSPNKTRSYTYYPLGMLATDNDRSYAYDQYDRINSVQAGGQPLAVQLDYTYSAQGYLNTIMSGTTTLFDGITMNGFGKYKNYILADGQITNVYYEQQYPVRIRANGIQDLNMTYDYTTGNLTSRWDKTKALKETFAYDALDRLTSAQVDQVNGSGNFVSSVSTNTYSYDGTIGNLTKGNLTQRSDIGKFGYNTLNRVIAANGSLYPFPSNDPPAAISQNTQDITYTSYYQPKTVTETVGGAANLLQYSYDANHQRCYSKLSDPDHPSEPPIEERWYENGIERQRFEADISTDQVVLYVQGGDGICAMIVANGDGQTIYAVHKDHLGSIVSVVKKVGTVTTIVAEQNFDPWGRRRNATNWTYASIGSVPNWLFRGYTGHEHVEPFALINMNGRMYDPLNGRMLSVDNFVQGGTQGFNRYSYALNNPLKYSDPSGEFLWLIPIAAAVFGIGNLSVQASNGEINNFGDGFNAFVSGAVAGFALASGVASGLTVPILGTAIKTAGWVYAGTAVVSAISGAVQGLTTGNWTALENSGKIFAGNFYLDSERNFLGQTWQGISRFSWELPQSIIGHGVSQLRNTFGAIDRVDYFGGATFSTSVNPDADFRWGVSLGNHININRRDNAFDVLNDPLLMHEYGHTFDSQIFGLTYLFSVGLPSVLGAQWTEFRANQHAARYFGNRFGVDWSPYETIGYPLSR